MSKLFNNYNSLKLKEPNQLFLFKSGIFFIALSDDAIKLNEIFSFKLTTLTNNVVKCGFPQNRLDYYSKMLNQLQIQFKIIDDNYSKIENYSDYLNNNNLKSILEPILKLDMNDVSYKKAYEILFSTQKKLKEINYN